MPIYNFAVIFNSIGLFFSYHSLVSVFRNQIFVCLKCSFLLTTSETQLPNIVTTTNSFLIYKELFKTFEVLITSNINFI